MRAARGPSTSCSTWEVADRHSVNPAASTGKRAVEYGIYGLPETFIINANGVIVAKITGGVTTESLRSAIRSAFSTPPE